MFGIQWDIVKTHDGTSSAEENCFQRDTNVTFGIFLGNEESHNSFDK